MSDRVKEMKGSLKEAAGDMLGNEQWQAEGKAERLQGKAQREMKGAGNEAVGSVKKGAGRLFDNEQMEAEGEAQRLKGKAQRSG